MDRGVKPTQKKVGQYTLPKKKVMVWLEHDKSIWVLCSLSLGKKKHLENSLGKDAIIPKNMNDEWSGHGGASIFPSPLIGGNFQLEIPCGCYDLSRKHPERFSHHREPLESSQLTTHPETPLPSQPLADRLWLRKLPSASVPHAEGTSGISRFGWTDVFFFFSVDCD